MGTRPVSEPEDNGSTSGRLTSICRQLRDDLPHLLGEIEVRPTERSGITPAKDEPASLATQLQLRLTALHQQLVITTNSSEKEIQDATKVFLRWMQDGTVVRVVGAGRARLAAAIPANRLAHGGARVFIQDDILPMPHTIKGGGIIAASASGTTPSVLQTLAAARRETRDVQIVGIASSEADEFRSHCDIFVGITQPPPDVPNPLKALADSEEYVISGLLDAIVVAAGALGGFSVDRWRIGHENMGPTGPYDLQP